ncbi:MAG: NAD(P)/FAD-dependent oxidoreductase [Prevotella sp.]|nr:NAD(P)/FAD-dependent oxidoreductase [Prevotellaceae bacterium]MDY3935446.1 NAD(P)/FAD-dependent oxidoreductase [Prevotella sp.]
MTDRRKIAIIGGGAAGFFAAISAKETNPSAQVCIYEKATRVLSKVAISGGGRCNLTNSFEEITDLKMAYPRGDKLLKRLFKSFSPADTYAWFEAHGVNLITQEDQCVFPKTQSSQTVIDCLMKNAKSLGIQIKNGYELERLSSLSSSKLKVSFRNKGHEVFDKVIITTGGSPKMDKLLYLADLGHQIEQPVPSLFTFNIADTLLKELMGVVVQDVLLSIPSTKFSSRGILLVTHWGISGPATLKLSSYAARYLNEQSYDVPLSINWVAGNAHGFVTETLHNASQEMAKKQIGTVALFGLSNRTWQHIVLRSGLKTEKLWGEMGKKGIHKLAETLTNDTYHVTGKGRFKDEFVTCGGVSLKSININTLESKQCPGLFFAGEVLDIDGITGGFNLQAAWTTGKIAGSEI